MKNDRHRKDSDHRFIQEPVSVDPDTDRQYIAGLLI